MPDNSVAVVIPFYRETLTEYEKISLTQCGRVLGEYPIIAIKPQKITLPDINGYIKPANILSFDNEYFNGVAGYNRLMLSPVFYREFFSFEFILIYQLDAFVFKNELKHWCSLGLDYIGAPWIRRTHHTRLIKTVKANLQRNYFIKYNILSKGLPSGRQFENKVGNGGFSLRRVRVFHDTSIAMSQTIASYLEKGNIHQYNEDAFWSIEVNRQTEMLKIATLAQGLKFAFESYPERAYLLNKQCLPFGCHAWNLYLNYWRPIFKAVGYNI